jgi:hypothetical protein
MAQISSIKTETWLPFSQCKTAPKKSKMPPFGGLGTIYVSHRDVNKTADLAGAAERLKVFAYTQLLILQKCHTGQQVGENPEIDSP